MANFLRILPIILLVCMVNVEFLEAKSHKRNKQSRSIGNRGVIDSIKDLLGIGQGDDTADNDQDGDGVLDWDDDNDGIPDELDNDLNNGEIPDAEMAVEKDCVSGWTAGPNGACYFFPSHPETERGNFHQANTKCRLEALGWSSMTPAQAHVLSIETEGEQKFIENLLADFPETDFWTNGNRLNKDGNKIWHWGNNPASIEDQGFVNWDEGQPQWSSPWGKEECIFLGHKSLFNFKWHDHRCSYDLASYVCEYSRNDPKSELKPGAHPSDDEDSSSEHGSGHGSGHGSDYHEYGSGHGSDY